MNKPCVRYLRVWTKSGNCWEILRNFSKFSKICLRKLQKLHYFNVFFKKVNKQCVTFFARLDQKHKLLGNFEKFFENFQNFS